MARVVDIRCPHCDVTSRALLPEDGLLVLGPCPACHEFVLLVAGIPLPVDKQVILYGSTEEKQEHLFSVLSSFLEQRINLLIDQVEENTDRLTDYENARQFQRVDHPEMLAGSPFPDATPLMQQISTEEVRQFVEEELPRLDDSEYFKTIFH
ncbi:MAG TPA: hypothetical protein PKY35_14460 [Candidatus Hydrogenedentes bacterium]|nr:hypothetical protein [Candidatus Hydrogenedentota bacterium]HOL78221.1 hypothetical protein [Candidatus Hydrogenedentota bacterium]HPO84526.1 hypothetical protein [Candidatus Hydrogenedentota bacterium]